MLTVLPPLAILPDIGGGEMLVVLLLVLLLFGGDKMPHLAKGLGKAIREFKKAASDVEQEFKRAMDEVPDPAATKPVAPTTPPAMPVNRIEPPAAPPSP